MWCEISIDSVTETLLNNRYFRCWRNIVQVSLIKRTFYSRLWMKQVRKWLNIIVDICCVTVLKYYITLFIARVRLLISFYILMQIYLFSDVPAPKSKKIIRIYRIYQCFIVCDFGVPFHISRNYYNYISRKYCLHAFLLQNMIY